MITTRKNLKVSIFGKSYALTTDESPELIYQAAAMVDSLMQGKETVFQAGTLDKLALLTALQLAADLIKVKKDLEAYENRCLSMLVLTEE